MFTDPKSINSNNNKDKISETALKYLLNESSDYLAASEPLIRAIKEENTKQEILDFFTHKILDETGESNIIDAWKVYKNTISK